MIEIDYTEEMVEFSDNGGTVLPLSLIKGYSLQGGSVLWVYVGIQNPYVQTLMYYDVEASEKDYKALKKIKPPTKKLCESIDEEKE